MEKIRIRIRGNEMPATLYDTPTAQRILEVLPLEGHVQVWGDEIYFSIPLILDLEPDARQEVHVGELGYWPQGPAVCIFFGPTPASTSEAPKAFSPVNVFGKTDQDARVFKGVPSGAEIHVEPLSPDQRFYPES
ncbi:MAG: hypothetical protein JRI76_00865 [Deltaproteobacteria bacterium]|nr:hypothetical protein [Deltaproteobacteria bacterium]MBW2040559.1 hypothetical protein [Deltaproteobacteria bacterium]MBW2131426.1 hypothetical protein [Deltaproteobacteria bacterium]